MFCWESVFFSHGCDYQRRETEKRELKVLTDNGFDVFQWHRDMFNIPVQGVHLAGNINCVNQAFKVGTNAYGLQFHVEADQNMTIDWTDGKYKDKPAECSTFREEIKTKLSRILKTGQTICHNSEQYINR